MVNYYNTLTVLVALFLMKSQNTPKIHFEVKAQVLGVITTPL